MKKEQSELLDRYLAGEAPQHPERLALPSDSELDEAEATFDQMMAERQQPSAKAPQQSLAAERKSRIIRLWPWVAAACLLVLIGIGAAWLKDEPENVLANSDGGGKEIETVEVMDKPKAPSDTLSAPVVPTEKPVEAPATRPAPLRFNHVRKQLAQPEEIPDTLGSHLWKSERNVMLALQMLSDCEETIRKGEQSARNKMVEAEFRATVKGLFVDAETSPAIELIANENGDYEIVAANQQNIIEI